MMNRHDVLELANDSLIPVWLKEREAQQKLEDWAAGKHTPPYKPAEANAEYKALLSKSSVPLLGLVVKILSQGLEITDYEPGNADNHDLLWAIWKANRMPERQRRLWRAALTGGIGYALGLPGVPTPVVKLFSGKNMIAVYQDPEFDEWPMFAAYGSPASPTSFHFNIVDETSVYTLGMNATGGDVEFITFNEHGAGVTPVVRFMGETDTEGNVTGEVEPLIPIQASIDQSKFDMLMTQTFASYKIRYAAGMATPETDAEAEQIKLILGRDRILVSDNPETKFGTLDGTDLLQYIEASKASKQELATVAQISHKYVVGAQSNTSSGAEAQAADEASTMRKIHDYTRSFGESNEQLNRLTGLLAGIPGAWEDYDGVTSWRDSAIRSLAQIADAVQKLGDEKLGIPKEALWGMLPDVGPGMVKKWRELADSDPLGQLVKSLNAEPDGA